MSADAHFFLRREDLSPYGCVAVLTLDDAPPMKTVAIGMSFCKAKDKWNRVRAKDIALDRAYKAVTGVPGKGVIVQLSPDALDLAQDIGHGFLGITDKFLAYKAKAWTRKGRSLFVRGIYEGVSIGRTETIRILHELFASGPKGEPVAELVPISKKKRCVFQGGDDCVQIVADKVVGQIRMLARKLEKDNEIPF